MTPPIADIPRPANNSVPLRYAVSLNPETLPETTPPDFEFQYVDISAIEGGVLDIAPQLVRFEDAPSRARRVVRAGDIIISTVRTYLKAVASFPELHSSVIASTGFAVLRPNGQLHPRFAYWAVLSEPFIQGVVAHSEGVSYPAISPSELGTLRVPAYDYSTQETIANFLDKKTAEIDALVTAKQRLDRKLVAYEQSLLTHAMSTAITNGTKQLRFAAASIGQGWSPTAGNWPASPGEWGVLKLSAIKEGNFLPSENKAIGREHEVPEDLRVRLGDVLVSRANTPELVGAAAYVGQDDLQLITSDLIYTVRANQNLLCPRFLVLYLNSGLGRAQIEANARGSSQSMVKISQEHLKSIRIPDLPMDEQLRVVARLTPAIRKVRQLRQHMQRHVRALHEYRASLITASVTNYACVERAVD